MKTIRKTFYLLSPSYKKANLLFANKEVQKSKLFKSLSLKLVPKWYIKLRKFKPLDLFLKQNTTVPEEETFLIYDGYDSKIFFYKEEGEIKVKRAIGEKYKEESFLGYPIHWDFTLREIPNLSLIKEVLKKHWQKLKEDRNNLHGDFTHSNILVSEGKKVSIIDKKNVASDTPIINDLFYFYSYFLRRAKVYSNDLIYENQLGDIFRDILQNDQAVLETISNLKLENFHFSKREDTFAYWKNRFRNFLVENLEK